MKKKLFIVVLGLFLFIPILNVNAAEPIELTQAMFDAAKITEQGNRITFHTSLMTIQ